MKVALILLICVICLCYADGDFDMEYREPGYDDYRPAYSGYRHGLGHGRHIRHPNYYHHPHHHGHHHISGFAGNGRYIRYNVQHIWIIIIIVYIYIYKWVFIAVYISKKIF